VAHSSPTKRRHVFSSVTFNDGLSNRLSSTVDRARFLGMIVGEALSRRLDSEERRLLFKVPETEDPNAETWRSIIDVDDTLTPVKDLQAGIVEEPNEETVIEGPEMLPAEEILVDEEEDLDTDLRKYPVPDSDAEDSDEDPTLISRDKPTTPLYPLPNPA
jgi:telomere length regulation protein